MLGSVAELTRGRLLARNVALNVGGWAIPALCALAAIPALVAAMGADRFGLLALAWTLVGAFSPFDLGIGRALTQALAERVGRADQDDSPTVAWTASWLLLGVGLAGGALLAIGAPTLVERWLHVPAALRGEAVRALQLLALAVPLTTLTSGLRGVLEAGQAFRAVNALRLPLALLSFVGPLAVQPLSHGLPAALLVLVLARVLVLALHAVVVVRLYPALRRPRAPQRWALRALWRVAGWITVTTLATPVLVTGDRFLIGAALPVAALAQYAAVSEVALKLTVVGSVLQPVLFPAIAATLVPDPMRAGRLFDRAIRAIAAVVAPAALVMVLLAPEGLRLWLGPRLAHDAAPVLQLLAIASYVNTFAQMPYVTLQGAGRADVPAKLHLLEVPLYLAALWLLLARFGLAGAALAWLLRMAVDALALFVAVRRTLPDAGPVLRRSLVLTFGGAAALGGCALVGPFGARLLVGALALPAMAWGVWHWLLLPDERAMLAGALAARRAGEGATVAPADVR